MVISSGIEPGEQIIITDLIPVIEGMPLQVITASEYEDDMKKRAIGEDVRG